MENLPDLHTRSQNNFPDLPRTRTRLESQSLPGIIVLCKKRVAFVAPKRGGALQTIRVALMQGEDHAAPLCSQICISTKVYILKYLFIRAHVNYIATPLGTDW
jgi:hypothetical protein